MKRTVVLGIAFLIFAAAGIYERTHHPDIQGEYMQTGDCGEFLAPAFDIRGKSLLEYEREYYKDADLVVQAELAGTPESGFGWTKVPLRICKVYRGEGLEPGDEIQYISNIDFIGDLKEFDGYINFMREDTPYLVFLNRPGIDYHEDNIYLAPEVSLYPYFAMEEIENVYDREEWEQLGRANYLRTVQGNEFFVNSEEALELLLDFKKEILETYVTE